MQDVVHRRRPSHGKLDTIHEPEKEDCPGQQASKDTSIPSDIVVVKGDSDNEGGRSLDNFAHRTLATLTETFTSTSEDNTAFVGSFELPVHGLDVQEKFSVSNEGQSKSDSSALPRNRWPSTFTSTSEDNTAFVESFALLGLKEQEKVSVGNEAHLPSDSSARPSKSWSATFTSSSEDNTTFVGSFELHGLDVQENFRIGNEEPVLPASSTARPRNRWPTDFYRRHTQNPPVRQPVAPSLLLSSSSNDSWDEQNGDPRQVSLLDMMESRDEEDEGHYGDDERDAPEMDEMLRMTMQFQKSHDSHSPVNHSFQGSLPKFAQRPLSHLRSGRKAAIEDMNRPLYTGYTSSSSYASPRNSDHANQQAYLHSVEKVEKERKNEKSITEKKGVFQSLRDLIYCVPGSGGN